MVQIILKGLLFGHCTYIKVLVLPHEMQKIYFKPQINVNVSHFSVNKIVFLPPHEVFHNRFSLKKFYTLVALCLPLLFVCRFCMSCDQRVVPKSTSEDVSVANFS